MEATVGRDVADLVLKETANARLDATLAPLRLLARAWSGAVMLAERECNDEWLALARVVAANGTWPCSLTKRQEAMLDLGKPGPAMGFDVPGGVPGGRRRRTAGRLRCCAE